MRSPATKGACADCGRGPLFLERGRRCRPCATAYRFSDGYVPVRACRPPEDMAEVDRRIRIYAARAERGEPLFDRIPYPRQEEQAA